MNTPIKDAVNQANYTNFRTATDCSIDGKPENRLLSRFGA